MSSRAASSGGLAAEMNAAPATSNQMADPRLPLSSPGMSTAAAAR